VPRVSLVTAQRKLQSARSETVYPYVGRVGIRPAGVVCRWHRKRTAVFGAPRLLPGLLRRYRDGESLPPFCPTAFEHVAPSGTRHPGKKAVGAFASTIVGLIGSFHLSRPTPVPKLSPAIKCRSQAEFWGRVRPSTLSYHHKALIWASCGHQP